MEQEFQAREKGRGNGPPSNGRDNGPRTQAHGVAAVDRGAELLVRVLESKQPIALTELASASGIPKSTASRLMTALERRGLVEQDGPRGRLRPGPAILRVAERGLLERNVVEMSRESLDALGEATGETINLAVAGRDGVEHVAQVESRHFVGVGQWLGRAVEYHCTANGKVFLAFGRATLPDPPLRRFTPKTITDPAQLEAELETVRRQGFATTVDELETGLGRGRSTGSSRRRRRGRRAEHLRADAADDAAADPRARAGSDRGGPLARAAPGAHPRRRERRMTERPSRPPRARLAAADLRGALSSELAVALLQLRSCVRAPLDPALAIRTRGGRDGL